MTTMFDDGYDMSDLDVVDTYHALPPAERAMFAQTVHTYGTPTQSAAITKLTTTNTNSSDDRLDNEVDDQLALFDFGANQ